MLHPVRPSVCLSPLNHSIELQYSLAYSKLGLPQCVFPQTRVIQLTQMAINKKHYHSRKSPLSNWFYVLLATLPFASQT